MRKLIVVSIVFFFSVVGYAQNEVSISKAMSNEFAKEYKGEKVSFNVQFYAMGDKETIRPAKVKFGNYPFKVNEIGIDPVKEGLTLNNVYFCYISKKNDCADLLKSINKGDEIKITGEIVLTGINVRRTYFVIDSIEKVNIL